MVMRKTSIDTRIARLEGRRGPPGHVLGLVEVPWDADRDAYLAAIPCPCGAGGDCPEKRFLLVTWTRCRTVEEWQTRVQDYLASRQDPPPEIPNADLVVVLNK
jgi:hypothetical protein